MNATLQTEPRRLQQFRKLTQVSRALTYAASLDDVLKLTVDRAADLFAAERSLLMVANDDGVLTVRSSYGIDAALARDIAGPLNEALASRIAGLLQAGPESFLAVPLVVNGGIKGILVVIRPVPSSDAADDEWLLSALADQAAVALEQDRLNDIASFREQLIGIVGHDLRNPLSTILMGAQFLLMSEGLGARETELARKITSSATVATRLIDQLLDLTRSRLGGGIPIDPAPIDLAAVVRQVVGETELTHPHSQLRVHVGCHLTGSWDRVRIYQLLENLIGNAVHHGEPRAPIDVRIEGGEAEIEIAVSNRGEPIPPEMMPFIFEAFRKTRSRHPTRASGLGLGLFIAQQIAFAHGGEITVTSSENDGTTFRVRLPRGG